MTNGWQDVQGIPRSNARIKIYGSISLSTAQALQLYDQKLVELPPLHYSGKDLRRLIPEIEQVYQYLDNLENTHTADVQACVKRWQSGIKLSEMEMQLQINRVLELLSVTPGDQLECKYFSNPTAKHIPIIWSTPCIRQMLSLLALLDEALLTLHSALSTGSIKFRQFEAQAELLTAPIEHCMQKIEQDTVDFRQMTRHSTG